MKLIKLSSIFAVLGFAFFGMSYLAARGLEETKRYSFPQSVGRHYAAVSGKVFEGGNFGNGTPTIFKKSVPMGSSFPFDTVDIETTAVNVEISESKTDEIEIELMSNKVDPKEPVLIDVGRGKTLRIMTQEGDPDRAGRNGWMVFNFSSDSDSKPMRNNLLQVRVPKTVTIGQIRTASGGGKLATALTSLHFQSKSGGFSIATGDNPLARVTDLSFESVSGGLKGPGRFDRLKFNSVSGDIRLFNLDRVLEIDGHSVSGNIVLETSELLDAEIGFQSTSGDIKIARSLLPKGSQAKPEKNEPYKIGAGTMKIHVQSISGDLKIRPTRAEKTINKTEDNSDEQENDRDDSDDNAMLNEESLPRDEFPSRNQVPAHNAARSYAVTRVGNAISLAKYIVSPASAIAGTFSSSVSPVSLDKNLSSTVAEEFLRCVAQLSVKESTRMGSASVRRCVQVLASLKSARASAVG